MVAGRWTLMTFIGAGLGITLSFLITLCISIGLGTGQYYACPPELIDVYGSELAAVEVQTVISAVYGAACVQAARIWLIERWGLVVQSAVFFAILCTVGMLCGYYGYWMEHTFAGAARFLLIFAAIFAAIWIAEYAAGRRKVREMNRDLQKAKSGTVDDR